MAAHALTVVNLVGVEADSVLLCILVVVATAHELGSTAMTQAPADPLDQLLQHGRACSNSGVVQPLNSLIGQAGSPVARVGQ